MTLVDYLKINGLTQDQFARRLGCDRSTVSRIASGKVNPDRVMVEAIFKASDGQITPNDLFGLPPGHGSAPSDEEGGEEQPSAEDPEGREAAA